MKRKQAGKVAPPSIALLALEPVRAAADYCVSLLGSLPRLRGDGHPVLVLPGLAAGDWSTLRMRSVLRRSGFEAHAWGMGINRGPKGEFDAWLGGLVHKVHELHGRSGGRKVSLVGWSLGGIYARELAKRVPHLVRQVITLGSPFADPMASHVGGVYRLLNGGKAEMTPQLARQLREDPPVPTTAIYSKTDGVVAWRACTSAQGGRCENIEVSTASHCGMGTHPQVLRIVLERLAQAEGEGRRWQAPQSQRARRGRAPAYGA